MVTVSADRMAAKGWLRRRRDWTVLFGAFVLWVGCRSEVSTAPEGQGARAAQTSAVTTPTPPDTSLEVQRGQVAQLVRDVFASMVARDCPRLESLVAGQAREHLMHGGGCQHVVETEPETLDVTLVSMEPPRRDGRAPGAWMVHVLTRNRENEQPALVRVEWTRDGFRLVNM